MNLDEMAAAIRALSSDRFATELSELLSEWKANDSDAHELEAAVECSFGNPSAPFTAHRKEILQLWSCFRDQAVRGIGGMTMNERLYWFSLFERFDNVESDEERRILYAKLLAHP